MERTGTVLIPFPGASPAPCTPVVNNVAGSGIDSISATTGKKDILLHLMVVRKD
jgi:hypothetical protein